VVASAPRVAGNGGLFLWLLKVNKPRPFMVLSTGAQPRVVAAKGVLMTIALTAVIAGALAGLLVPPAVWLIAYPEDIKARMKPPASIVNNH
jgi:hypothetical protein